MKRVLIYFVLSGLLVSCSQVTPVVEEEVLANLPKVEILANQGNVFDGYIMLRKLANPGAQFMINSRGEVVWYQFSDTTILRVFTPYEESYLALYSKKAIHDITYGGDTLVKLVYGKGGYDKLLHHEIIKDKENNIIGLSREDIAIDLSEHGGELQDTIHTDGILKLSDAGEKLWSWRITDVMNPLTFPDINKWKRDWGHANALAIDTDGNFIISWRDFNEIWKINSNTGHVIWKYGGKMIENKADRFYGQHNIHRNVNGDYILFDNGDARIRRSSRIVTFSKKDTSFINTLTINLPDSLFTVKQGSVYQVTEDKFLVSSTMRKTLAIVSSAGDILWLAKSDTEFYRAYYMPKSIL